MFIYFSWIWLLEILKAWLLVVLLFGGYFGIGAGAVIAWLIP